MTRFRKCSKWFSDLRQRNVDIWLQMGSKKVRVGFRCSLIGLWLDFVLLSPPWVSVHEMSWQECTHKLVCVYVLEQTSSSESFVTADGVNWVVLMNVLIEALPLLNFWLFSQLSPMVRASFLINWLAIYYADSLWRKHSETCLNA